MIKLTITILLVLFLLGCGAVKLKQSKVPVEQRIAGNIISAVKLADIGIPESRIRENTHEIFIILGAKLDILQDNKLDLDELFGEIKQVESVDPKILDLIHEVVKNNVGNLEVELEQEPAELVQKMRTIVRLVLSEIQ